MAQNLAQAGFSAHRARLVSDVDTSANAQFVYP